METEKRSYSTTLDSISSMISTLHPTLRREGEAHLEALRQLIQLSKERYAQGAYWKYVVVEPKPSRYALRAAERTKRGWIISFAQSKTFTGDYRIAKSAAELFTRAALPPARLAKAISDYMRNI